MLGLWSVHFSPLFMGLPLAFREALPQIEAAVPRLRCRDCGRRRSCRATAAAGWIVASRSWLPRCRPRAFTSTTRMGTPWGMCARCPMPGARTSAGLAYPDGALAPWWGRDGRMVTGSPAPALRAIRGRLACDTDRGSMLDRYQQLSPQVAVADAAKALGIA